MFTALNQPVPPEAQGGRGGGSGTQAARAASAAGTRARRRTSAGGVPNVADSIAAPAAKARRPRRRTSRRRLRKRHRPLPSRHVEAAAPTVRPAPAGEAAAKAGGGFGGGGAGGTDGGDRQARMLERLKAMSPDEQKQFIARMKERGVDTTAFEKLLAPEPKGKGGKTTAKGGSTAAGRHHD